MRVQSRVFLPDWGKIDNRSRANDHLTNLDRLYTRKTYLFIRLIEGRHDFDRLYRELFVNSLTFCETQPFPRNVHNVSVNRCAVVCTKFAALCKNSTPLSSLTSVETRRLLHSVAFENSQGTKINKRSVAFFISRRSRTDFQFQISRSSRCCATSLRSLLKVNVLPLPFSRSVLHPSWSCST